MKWSDNGQHRDAAHPCLKTLMGGIRASLRFFVPYDFAALTADDGAIWFAEESAPPAMHLAAPGSIERLAAAHWAAFQ